MITSGNITLRKPVLSFSGFKESKTDFLKLKQFLSGPGFPVYGLLTEIYATQENPFFVLFSLSLNIELEKDVDVIDSVDLHNL